MNIEYILEAIFSADKAFLNSKNRISSSIQTIGEDDFILVNNNSIQANNNQQSTNLPDLTWQQKNHKQYTDEYPPIYSLYTKVKNEPMIHLISSSSYKMRPENILSFATTIPDNNANNFCQLMKSFDPRIEEVIELCVISNNHRILYVAYKSTKTMNSRDIIISLMFILIDKYGNILFNTDKYETDDELLYFISNHSKNSGGYCMAYFESIDEKLIPKHLMKNQIPRKSGKRTRSCIIRNAFICQDLTYLSAQMEVKSNYEEFDKNKNEIQSRFIFFSQWIPNGWLREQWRTLGFADEVRNFKNMKMHLESVDCTVFWSEKYFYNNLCIEQDKGLSGNDDDFSVDVDDGNVKCIVCWENDKNYIILPCGHLCLCGGCKTELENSETDFEVCIVCDQKIESIVKVFS